MLLYFVRRYTGVILFLDAGIGIISCFVVGYLASLVIPRERKPFEGLTLFTRRRATERRGRIPATA